MNNNIIEIDDNKIKNGYSEINNYSRLNKDIEGVPVISSLEISSYSVEEYYKTYYPEYKIIKFGKFTFIRMGRLLTFFFDKKNNYVPRLSIGPHWCLTIVLLLLILSLVYLIYFSIMKKLGEFKSIIFFLFVFSVYYFVLCAALIHPKVVMNKIKNPNEYGYCTLCKAYYNPYNKVEHCPECEVCFEKMDHHCIWVGKCVAKNNAFYFYGMIVDIVIFYIYIIYCAILVALEKRKK